jgi:hypothetical protein
MSQNQKLINKKSFTAGFFRGLSAPFLIFYMPTSHAVEDFQPVMPAVMRSGDPLTEDWKAVGIDLWTSVEKYGKEHAL